MRSLIPLCALGVGVALGGCQAPVDPAGTTPALQRAATAASATGANGFAVTTLRLRSPIGGGSTMWGVFHATFGTFYPPSPCVGTFLPAVQSVAVCTIIHNPGGEQLTGGEVVLHPPSPNEPITIPIRAAFPPSPCRSYLIRGSVAFPPSPALASDTPITASFSSDAGVIVTIPPGPPQIGDYGQAGGLGSTGASNGANPVDGAPLSQPVCTVNVGPVGE
jgi:hypothetical protein